MSKKPLTITEQIAQLELENARISELDKLFDRACELYFEMNSKSIKKALKTNSVFEAFTQKIVEYFGLKNSKDLADFLRIICNDGMLNLYQRKIAEMNADEQG